MNRIRTIDFLRGIAVILVLFRHHEFFEPLHQAGWIGVDLFFVLSGYLVSSLLFNEYVKSGNVKPIKFLIRRGFKIYPLFYLAIFLTILLESLGSSEILTTYNITSEVLFVQNYFGQLWNHTWSLAVEEHFYIGLAIILYLTIYFKGIENKKVMVTLFVSILILCLLLRLENTKIVYSHSTHLIPTHIRMDSLIFGVLLSYLHIFCKVNFEKIINKYCKGP